MYHKENRGLRSEDKFNKFMDNIRDARVSSEAFLQKNSDAVYDMHEKSPEKVVRDSINSSRMTLE